MKGTTFGTVAVACFVFVLTGCAPQVKVSVMNSTEQPLRQMQIHYTGGMAHVGDVPARQQRSVEIRPGGESSVVLRYVDAAGVEHSKDLDVYLEPSYKGTIAVQVESGGRVEVLADVRSP